MKKIIAFGASNSASSINKQFAVFAAHALKGAEVEVLDLNDFEFPIYSMDRERNGDIPASAHLFIDKIRGCDGVVLSLAEHNGTYTVAFKNVMDWCSRIQLDFFGDKPVLLLSTAPGAFGGGNVMEAALKRLPKFKANIVAHFSLPKFGENFDGLKGIVSSEYKSEFERALDRMTEAL